MTSTSTTKEQALTAAGRAAAEYRAARDARVAAIIDAQSSGATWTEIATATGLPRAAAHQLAARRLRPAAA